MVNVEVVFQVANGTVGAVVNAADALQFEPAAKDKVAAVPTKPITVCCKLTVPVTVVKELVPPDTVTILAVEPPIVNVPEMSPVFPVPEKAKAQAFDVLTKFKVLPDSITKSFPPPPVMVVVRVVVVSDCKVRFVLLVTLN